MGHLQLNSSQPIGELATSGCASLWYLRSAPVQIYPLAEVPMGLCVVLKSSAPIQVFPLMILNYGGPKAVLCGARAQPLYWYSL